MIGPYLYAGYRCNNNCIFCSEADRPAVKKPLSLIEEEIGRIRRRYDFINIMGLEPTIRDDLRKVVFCAKKRGFRQIGITTNGRMLSYEAFARGLIEAGVNQFVVTLAGHDAVSHDRATRSKGSFRETLQGIRNVAALKGLGVSLLVNVAVFRATYRSLSKIIALAVRLGANEINLLNISPVSGRSRTRRIIAPLAKAVPLLADAVKRFEKTGVKFLLVEFPPCALPPSLRPLSFGCMEEIPGKVRIPACADCLYRKSCKGILQDYVKMYGEKELKKIPGFSQKKRGV